MQNFFLQPVLVTETMSSPAEKVFDNVFCFESYGVSVSLESNSAAILDTAKETAQKALLQNLEPCESGGTSHVFRLEQNDNGDCSIYQDGQRMVTGPPDVKFFRFFDSLVRILVAEFCRSFVFVHSGVVAWNGKAILIPANSFSGKTTLVAELIRSGAVYYSDEYAILDRDGRAHPFPRKLSLRNSVGTITETDIDPSEYGAAVGDQAVQIGTVLFTKYEPGIQFWAPELQSAGNAIVEMINYTIPIRRNPVFSLEVLRKSLEGSVSIKCPRGDVSEFVPFLLDFVDNTVI